MASELMIFIRAKELCSLIVKVTDTSPKKFRFTFTIRMQNMAMDIIEDLYLANETFVNKHDKSQYNIRRGYQNSALTKIKLLGYFAELALKEKAILPKQFERIAILCKDCQNLTGGWIKSDKSKLNI